MKHNSMLNKALLCLFFAAIAVAGFSQKPIKQISSAILTNTTWDEDTIYVLKGYIYVGDGNISGTKNVTLTIQPGTLIRGDTSTTNSSRKGALVITRNSKIIADGTPCKPIVFTSNKSAGKRNRGDWGGLILLGNAPINNPGGVANIEGIPANDTTKYGGTNATDNSGILRYVRVEFAGVALTVNNEINAVTFGGVGSATLVDFVQASYSNDDSFEWFGGTVNAKHLIAFRGIDDDFDTDNGFSGKLQFGVSLRDPNVADVSGSNGFESDNDATGSTNAPQTRARFSNFDVIAGADSATNVNFRRGVHIRRNSHMWLLNSIAMGWPVGVLIDGTTTEASVLADTLVENNIVAATYSPNWVTSTPTDVNVNNLLLTQAQNRFYAGNAGVMLTNPYNLTSPNFLPAAGSPALGTANFGYNALQDPFFEQVTYVGAFGTEDWTKTWANFNPTQADYTNGVKAGSLVIAGVVTNTGCTNGAVDVTSPAAGTGYNYSWSNGATTQDISGVAAGKYTLTATYSQDATCVASKSFTIAKLKPTILSGNSSQTTISITWDNVVNPEVSFYQVRIKKSSTGTWGPWVSTRTVVNTYTFTGLTKSTSYDMQVRGKCASGAASVTAPSATFTFSTCATCRMAAPAADAVSSSTTVLYPNPNNGRFSLKLDEFAGTVSIKVSNASGTSVYSQLVNGAPKIATVNVSIPNVPAGLYMVTISDGTKTTNTKVYIVK